MIRYVFLLFFLMSEPALASSAASIAPLFSISYEEAEDSVSEALATKGVGMKVAATIDGRRGDKLFSHSKPLRVEARGLRFDKASGHWNASLLAVSDGEVISALPAAGRFEEIIELPTVKHVLRSGEIIAADDIEVRDYPARLVRADTITQMADLIGQSPVYTISPGRPLRSHEVSAAAAVKKNAVVTMQYRSPGMEISTTGQALENGAPGALIPVRNLASKRVVQAVVVDEQTVRIASGPQSKPRPASITTEADARRPLRGCSESFQGAAKTPVFEHREGVYTDVHDRAAAEKSGVCSQPSKDYGQALTGLGETYAN